MGRLLRRRLPVYTHLGTIGASVRRDNSCRPSGSVIMRPSTSSQRSSSDCASRNRLNPAVVTGWSSGRTTAWDMEGNTTRTGRRVTTGCALSDLQGQNAANDLLCALGASAARSPIGRRFRSIPQSVRPCHRHLPDGRLDDGGPAGKPRLHGSGGLPRDRHNCARPQCR
jgi:hypothetical protein